MLPARALQGPGAYDESLKPFWERVAGNGLFAAVHGSFGALMPSFATGRYDNLFFSHMICHPFEQMAAMLDIVAGGVLERHPTPARRLPRIGAGLAGILARPARRPFRVDAPARAVDEAQADRAVPRAVLHLDRIGRGAPPAAAKEMGVDGCVFWGADYPHYDCTYPGAVTELEEHLAPLDPALADGVRWRTAERFLGWCQTLNAFSSAEARHSSGARSYRAPLEWRAPDEISG